MRKLFFGVSALAISVVGAPAAAQVQATDPGSEGEVVTLQEKKEQAPTIERVEPDPKYEPTYWYVGGEFGAMIVEDTDVDIGAVDNAMRLNYEYGYDGGIFVGYDLGAFRIEAEAAYKKANLQSFNTIIALPGENAVSFPPSREQAGGSESALSFMINGMLDFGDDDEVGGISGFVGGGIGMARVKANNQRVFANSAPFLDDSDSKLAWQVFAGVRQAITDNIDVTVKYRFFNVDDVRMVAFNGNESEHRFRSHSLLGGITFKFRKPRPPIERKFCETGWTMNPATNQCELVTERQVRRCPGDQTDYPVDYKCPIKVVGPFIVFFDWERWERHELSPEALRVLDDAAARYVREGSVQVSIEAHTDTSGSHAYNEDLASKRLATVQTYLVERGVPETAIMPHAFGERCPLVESGDGVREPMNRRVEIYYGDRRITGPCPPRPDAPQAY